MMARLQLGLPSAFSLKDFTDRFADIEKMTITISWRYQGHPDGHVVGALEAGDVEHGRVQGLCPC